MTAPAVIDPPVVTPPVTPPAPPSGGVPTSGTLPGDIITEPPAWKPPATKEEYDKALSEAVEAAKPKVPDKYDLKLPDKVTVDPQLTERTAATARALGLPQEAAQKTLDFIASEAARERDAALAAYAPPSQENPEGGAKWKEQDTAWKAAALKDKELGDGKPEKLAEAAKLATQVLAKFGDQESIDFVDSVLGSNPAVLRVLVRIGKAMGEKELVRAEGDGKPAEKSLAEIFYPKGPKRTEEEIKANP